MYPHSPRRTLVITVVMLGLTFGVPLLLRKIFIQPPNTEIPATDSMTEPRDVSACDRGGLERVMGLEVGAPIAVDWRVDRITCDLRLGCTRIDLAHADERLTLRVCRHAEGAPAAPATHAGSDVYYDAPASPDAALSGETMQQVFDAVLARMDAMASE
jgi:hypothetical protein